MEQIAIRAGRKLFSQHIQDYTPQDPYYETYIDNRGRERKRRRKIPPGLTPRDAKILKSVERRAHYLDKGFRIAGMRFGWTFIIGIVPGAGDVADAALNYLLVVRKAKQAEIPDWLLHKMLLNNAISAVIGFVPIVGDIILASFKANSRNAVLLEEFLRIRGAEILKAQAEHEASVQGQAVEGPAEKNHARPGNGGNGRKASGGWFSRRKSKENVLSTAASTPAGASSVDRGRFVEDVPTIGEVSNKQ